MNEPTETGLTDETALERLLNTATWLGKSEHIGDFRIWAGVLLDIHEYLKDRLQDKAVNVINQGTHYHTYHCQGGAVFKIEGTDGTFNIYECEPSAPVDIGDIEI